MKSLVEMKKGEEGLVVEVVGGERMMVRMREMGLRKQARIKLLSKGNFGGPVILELNGSRIALGRGMAKKIMVEVTFENEN